MDICARCLGDQTPTTQNREPAVLKVPQQLLPPLSGMFDQMKMTSGDTQTPPHPPGPVDINQRGQPRPRGVGGVGGLRGIGGKEWRRPREQLWGGAARSRLAGWSLFCGHSCHFLISPGPRLCATRRGQSAGASEGEGRKNTRDTLRCCGFPLS